MSTRELIAQANLNETEPTMGKRVIIDGLPVDLPTGLTVGDLRKQKGVAVNEQLVQVEGAVSKPLADSMSRGAIEPSTIYSTDAEVANLPSSLTVGLLGGVLRSLDLCGDRFLIALLVVDGRGQAPLLTEAQSAFAPGTNIVLVDGSEDAELVLLRALEGILGSALTAGRTERNGGQIVWHVPFELVQQGAIGEFIAQTVADLFETPQVIPVAS